MKGIIKRIASALLTVAIIVGGFELTFALAYIFVLFLEHFRIDYEAFCTWVFGLPFGLLCAAFIIAYIIGWIREVRWKDLYKKVINVFKFKRKR